MEFKIYKAKTVNDAITDALIELEITSDMIEYEVIEEGSSGLLGLFSKEAVIRARRKVTDDLDAQIHEIHETDGKTTAHLLVGAGLIYEHVRGLEHVWLRVRPLHRTRHVVMRIHPEAIRILGKVHIELHALG